MNQVKKNQSIDEDEREAEKDKTGTESKYETETASNSVLEDETITGAKDKTGTDLQNEIETASNSVLEDETIAGTKHKTGTDSQNETETDSKLVIEDETITGTKDKTGTDLHDETETAPDLRLKLSSSSQDKSILEDETVAESRDKTETDTDSKLVTEDETVTGAKDKTVTDSQDGTTTASKSVLGSESRTGGETESKDGTESSSDAEKNPARKKGRKSVRIVVDEPETESSSSSDEDDNDDDCGPHYDHDRESPRRIRTCHLGHHRNLFSEVGPQSRMGGPLVCRMPGELPRCDCCDLPDCLDSVPVRRLFGLLRGERPLGSFREAWLVAVPDPDGDALQRLNERTDWVSRNFRFHVPELKTGTQDSLITLTGQLPDLESNVMAVMHKLTKYLRDTLEELGRGVEETFRVHNVQPLEFVVRFLWNGAKFPPWYDTARLAEMIGEVAEDVEKAFARRRASYEELDRNVRHYEKRDSASLEFRYLGDIVKKEDFVLGSSFLTTLLVVVPNARVREWLRSYHSFSELVVPNSSREIFRDEKHTLFAVVVAKKEAENFEVNARKRSFKVRHYTFSKEGLEAERRQYENMMRAKMKHRALTFRWAKVNYEECFEAWIHIKALQVFVETKLRYGPHEVTEAMLALPLARKKLRKVLDSLYEDVAPALARGRMKQDCIPGQLTDFMVAVWYPYVFLTLDLTFVTTK